MPRERLPQLLEHKIIDFYLKTNTARIVYCVISTTAFKVTGCEEAGLYEQQCVCRREERA